MDGLKCGIYFDENHDWHGIYFRKKTNLIDPKMKVYDATSFL